MVKKIIGIDVGTSNSAAAALVGGKPTIIPSAEGTSLGGKAFPSYVAFTKDGQMLVGESAKRQVVSNPEGTVVAIKRKMGSDYKVKAHGKEYTPQQITAFILQKIKRDAEAFLGATVDKAVLTVPAYFNDNQRTATKDAGTIAGLEIIRIINEPTAAALAYGIDKTEKDQRILVYDFGGGTLDVTIMEFSEGVFEVISTSGNTQLGGTDMDNAIVDYVAKEFKKQSGIDVRNDKMASQRLREACEKAKIELSSVLETDLNLPFITADASGPKHLVIKLSRAKLDELVRPIIEKCKDSLDLALKDAKLTFKDMTKIIFVGGPTRMPIVQKFVENYTGVKVERGVDPMECVAIGAAIQAGVLTGEVKDVVLLDVTPLSLGIETLGGVTTRLIERNTTIPTKKSEIFSTAADNQTSVEINVLQGEREFGRDNVSLGRFHLMGLPPAPRGVPQIEVTFDIDSNGIINVAAKDLGTGKKQTITITASTKLSQGEIDKMVEGAKKFEEEDKKRRVIIETKNQAENLIYTTEKSLSDLSDKVTNNERTRITEIIERLKETIKGEDIHKIQAEMKELTQAFHEISIRTYQQTGQQGKQREKPEEEKRDERAEDAEYKVMDADE
ncbi:MAG: molecular chaperone DnaK [Candidatus Omnitrophica bacterium]|nr:molecular chaperone DnaK [Candidatus Omnitrophota bacterium]